MSEPVIVIRSNDMRRLNYCSRGVRQFFERSGLDYADFLRNGIPSDQLAATNNAMILKVIEAAREQQ